MKTKNNNTNFAQVEQTVSHRTPLNVPVPAIVKHFINTITGADVIEPIPGSKLYYALDEFSKTGRCKQAIRNYRFSSVGSIGFLTCLLVPSDHDKAKLTSYVSQKLYESFKEFYLNYMQAFLRKESKSPIEVIHDFCDLYCIPTSNGNLKSLENIWHKSTQKKGLSLN
jgi:hypothetical protein